MSRSMTMSNTPTIHILGMSTESSTFSSLQDKSNTSHGEQRLHGRIVLKKRTRDDNDISFDHVNVQVHGAIRNTIGSKVAVERFSSSTETLSALDFKPAYSATGQDTQEQEHHLDFSCVVPTILPSKGRKGVHQKQRREVEGIVASKTTDDNHNDSFIPSMSISGSTYVTRVTAIRDRHLVEGRCEVLYWVEAMFLKSNSNPNSRNNNNNNTNVVRRLTCPVDISSPCTPLEVSAGAGDDSDASIVKQIAKPQTWSTTFRCLSSSHHHHHHSRPAEISINLPRKLGYVVCDSSRLATGCRRLSIPISVNVKKLLTTQKQGRGVAAGAVEATESLKCLINSKWYTRRSFNVGSSAVESLINSTTVSTQKTTLSAPPLYYNSSSSENSDDKTYSTYTTTTTMDLNLLLPESSTTTPSVTSDLLDISYNLEIEMQFTLVDDANGAKTCYNTNLHLPVTLRTLQPQEILPGCDFDPLLGYVEEDHVRHAPPPYIC